MLLYYIWFVHVAIYSIYIELYIYVLVYSIYEYISKVKLNLLSLQMFSDSKMDQAELFSSMPTPPPEAAGTEPVQTEPKFSSCASKVDIV